MRRDFLIAFMLLSAWQAQAVINPELEKSIKDSALMYGGYGDESVICGGDVLGYQIISDNQSEVVVKVLITEQVDYCASIVQTECLAAYAKTGTSYLQKSFKCDL